MESIEAILYIYYSKNPAIKAYFESKEPYVLFIYPIEYVIEGLLFLYKLSNKQYLSLLKEIPYYDYNKALLLAFNPEIWNELKEYDSHMAKDGNINLLLLSIYLNERLTPLHMYELAAYLLTTCPKDFRYFILLKYYLYSKFQSTKS